MVSEDIRARLFLWCVRHCCFCGKQCSTTMEIHHIDENHDNDDEDNLIPVCFDCHGELPRYNPKHTKGTKYKDREIKTRREQIYELYTRQYLRQVDIQISNHFHHTPPQRREPGDVSCTVKTLSDDIPVKLRLRIVPYSNDEPLTANLSDLYSGKALWSLNPAKTVYGHFQIPVEIGSDPFDYRVEIFWSIVDGLDREHKMLPFSYVWNRPEGDWWFDPRVLLEGE